MHVTGFQFDIAWEDRPANYGAVREAIRTAEIPPGGLIVLPEMFSTGFSMDIAATAEPGETTETEAFLRDLAVETGAAVMGGFARPGAKAGFGANELSVFAPDGGRLANYRKIRTFRYTREYDHYERGAEVRVFDWGGFRICPLICYDLRFPELFRRGAALGAQLFTVIASWPAVREDHWVTLLRARAIENQAYVVGVNRTGRDPNWDYPGRSVAIDPHGKIVSDAGAATGFARAEIAVEVVEDWRREFPALKDLDAGGC